MLASSMLTPPPKHAHGCSGIEEENRRDVHLHTLPSKRRGRGTPGYRKKRRKAGQKKASGNKSQQDGAAAGGTPIWTIGSFKREAVAAISPDVASILCNSNPHKPKRYRYDTTAHLSPTQFEELERKFWKTIAFSAPLYGADTDGALFSPHLKTWNVASLPTMLNAMQATVRGMNSPYLYIGTWKAMFGIHTEGECASTRIGWLSATRSAPQHRTLY